MSYITLKDERGNDIEIKTAEDLLSLNGHPHEKYREALLEKIKENRSQGKEPFDSVDFPDCSQKSFGMNIAIITNDEEIKAAIIEQVSKYDSSKLEKFLLEQNVPSAWNTGLEEGIKLALFSSSVTNKKSLDAMIITSAKLMSKDLHKALPINEVDNATYGHYVEKRLEAGDKISQASARAIIDLLPEKPDWSVNKANYMSMDFIKYNKELVPQLMDLDLREFDDKEKKKMEDTIVFAGELNQQDYINKAQPQNLTRESFLKRTTMTLEDVKTYIGHGYSTDQAYLLLKQASTENDAVAKIKGQIVVEALDPRNNTEESLKNQTYKYSKEDILRGYKDNPEALKAFEPTIPLFIVQVIKEDETLMNNPEVKFLIESQNLGEHDIMSSEASLKEIAEKGLESGFRADLITTKVGDYLNKHREEIEKLKKSHELCLEKETNAEAIRAKHQEIEKLRRFIYDEGVRGDFVSLSEVTKLALAKAQGKEVKPFVLDEEQTKGLKGLFMKKSEKEAEAKRIAKKKTEYEAANKFINEFSNKYKDSPLVEGLTKIEDIERLYNASYQQNERYDGGRYTYHDKESTAQKIADFEKLEALYKIAQEKIDYQVNIEKTARETSGVKDVEEGKGVDVLSLKEQIRENVPGSKEMSVRTLYNTMQEMRGLGKATPHTSSKQDFSSATVDLNKIKEKSTER